jgi:hypothetical protein
MLVCNRYERVSGSQSKLSESGGADRDRTGDPLLAKQVLSQLSYSPGLRIGGPG